MRSRLKHRTPAELEVLIKLISRRIQEVECGNAYRSDVRKKKDAVWASITQDFNAVETVTHKASAIEIRTLWSRIKNKVKRQRKKAGPTAPLSDGMSAAVERMMQRALEALKPKKRPFQKRSIQKPPNPALDDSDTDCGDSPSGSRETSDPGNQPGVEAGSDGRSSPAAVDNCPRKQIGSPDKTTSSSLSKQGQLATPGPNTGGSSGPSARPQTPSCKGESVIYQTIALPTAVKNVPRPSSPRPSLTSNVPLFHRGVNSAYPVFHQGPNNTVWTRGKLPSPVPMQQTSSVPSPLHGLTQSTVMEDATRTQIAHNVQTQFKIQEVQALNSMEIALHEYRKCSEEISRGLTQTLHDAKMKTNSAAEEGQRALNDMLLKKAEELHQAKLRVEEEALNLQRELHEIKMQTAQSEFEQAELAKLLVKKKIEMADFELQQMQARSDGCSPELQVSE